MPAPLSITLSEEELDQLSSILSSFPHENSMSLEKLDGFFAAIHCSPSMVPFSGFLSEIWGDETGEQEAPFDSTESMNNFLHLLMRFWNDFGRRFQEKVFLPILEVDDETETAKGNQWAEGFLRGIRISGNFEELIANEDEGGSCIPILILAHEYDEDPEMRPFPTGITTKQREEILPSLCVGVTRIYHYFAPYRKAYARMDREKDTIRNTANKLGRNEPCYCGSGIKYKKCCLKSIVH